MNESEKQTQSIEFRLERYKYILQQIHFLNENIQKYLTLFQTLATAIIGGAVSIFLGWRSLNITADMAIAGIRGLLGLLVILALFVIISVVAGIFSWLDYRREEISLLDEAVGTGFREPPNIRNWWRWYETYIVAFIILAVVSIFWFTESQVIPLIK